MIHKIISQLLIAAKTHGHRRALVLSGDRQWAIRGMSDGLFHASLERVLWVNELAEPHRPAVAHPSWQYVNSTKARAILGQEFDAVVFDAHAGFNADAFGMVAGTVCGGGLLILLAPVLKQWSDLDELEKKRVAVEPYSAEQVSGYFIQRLIQTIKTAEGLVLLQEGDCLEGVLPAAIAPLTTDEAKAPDFSPNSIYRSQDQAYAVEALIKVATGHRRRPVVLTSDRGRGKSAALGLAAAQLLQAGKSHIIVTGPSVETLAPVFQNAARQLPGAKLSPGALYHEGALIEFVAPDVLVQEEYEPNLLLVDEAAAIPTPMLTAMLKKFSRIAFATTVHGYEGTGRGFVTRFYSVLDELTPGWRGLTMSTPVRWAANDPVEHFVFDALLLNAAAAPSELVSDESLRHGLIETLSPEHFLANEHDLRQVFGLLVQAHYRTRPFDLRVLLDGPNVSVCVMRHEQQVIGVALLAEEGGFDDKLAAKIYEGRRRPQGHLLPQTLSVHVGLEQAPYLRYTRVMRIAIHPECQKQGLGSYFLSQLSKQIKAKGIDCLGASFGASVEILPFWQRAGFVPARVGLTREHTSGTHSVVMLKPLSVKGHGLVGVAQGRFAQLFPHQLSESLADLDLPIAARLMVRGEVAKPELDPLAWSDLVAFGFGERGYDVIYPALWQLAVSALSDSAIAELLSDEEKQVLLVKVIQRRNWIASAAALDLPGRSSVLLRLRNSVRTLLACYGDDWLMSEAGRYPRH